MIMTDLTKLKVKLFADGADLLGIAEMAANPLIKGFTTNPTLMRKAGVADYQAFALEALKLVGDRPISFEVFADDFSGMLKQAREISSWGSNVFVKIPVTNTSGRFSGQLISKLSKEGIRLNITAVMTIKQVKLILTYLATGIPAIISVFAGRIADTGVDPVPHMGQALKVVRGRPNTELLWASPRELLNVLQADSIGCDIITATNDILKKLSLVGKNLDDYSLETVQMFYDDAQAAGYSIKT